MVRPINNKHFLDDQAQLSSIQNTSSRHGYGDIYTSRIERFLTLSLHN
jgi:hypothetical protein